MFTYSTSVKLHDTDAAGLLFFSRQFTIAHDAYELFMETIGFGFSYIIRESGFLLPVIHAEADFSEPLFVGDKLTVQLSVERIGETSFTLAYDLLAEGGKSAGTVRTVHVCIDRHHRGKRVLPNGLRSALEPYH